MSLISTYQVCYKFVVHVGAACWYTCYSVTDPRLKQGPKLTQGQEPRVQVFHKRNKIDAKFLEKSWVIQLFPAGYGLELLPAGDASLYRGNA